MATNDGRNLLFLTLSRGLGGGIERYVSQLTEAAADLGYEWHRHDLLEGFDQRLNNGRRAVFSAGAARRVMRLRPTHVLLTHPNLFVLSRVLKTIHRSRIVGFVHGDEVLQRDAAAQVARRSRHNDVTVAVSHFTRDRLVNVGIAEDRVPVLYPALTRSWLELCDRIRAPKAVEPTVVAVTRIDERAHFKGVDTLVELAGRLNNRSTRGTVHFRIIGTGNMLEHYRCRASSLKIAGLEFLGHLSDEALVRELKQAWVFALPSQVAPEVPAGEGFGIVYIEAAAAGLPVIGSLDGGAAETVLDRETGRLVNPRDVDELEATIRELLIDGTRRAQYGAAGRTWVYKNFRPSRMQQDIRVVLGAADASQVC